MNTQTPPEKMTAEEAKEILWRLAKFGAELSDRQREAIVSALSHLEGAQADKARLDWLENHEWQMVKNASSGMLGCVKIPVNEYSSMHSTSVREMLDRCIAGHWEGDATKIRVSAMASQTEGERP